MSNASDAAGRSIADFVIPVIAIATLNAHADAIGFMNALQTLPFMLLGIPIGYLADRIAVRQLISMAAILKFVTVGLLLVCLVLDSLNLVLIYVIATLIGAASVASESGQTVAAARLSEKASLTALYAKLQSADNVIGIVAPALAGIVIGYSASGAIGLALVAFGISLVAAGFLTSLSPNRAEGSGDSNSAEIIDEEERQKAGSGPGIWAGLAETVRNRVVRDLTIVTMITNSGLAILGAVEVIFILRTLELSPWVVGVVEAFAGVGGVIGASMAAKIIERFDLRTILSATALGCLAMAAVLPIAAVVPAQFAIMILCFQTLGWGVMMLISNIAMTTWSVSVIPPEILGRTAAAGRTLTMGIVPVASILGGFFAVAVGTMMTIFVWIGLTGVASALTLTLVRRQRMSG